MDNYIRKVDDKYFDKNGDLASQGKFNKQIIKKIMSHEFFTTPPPKSLDRNSFIDIFYEVLNSGLVVTDIMATLAEITVESIFIGTNLLPKKVKNIIITGGGYKNNYLMKRLNNKLSAKIIDEEKINFNFDYIESELIAFLSARSIYKLPITFPSTTGISMPLSGGKIYRTS